MKIKNFTITICLILIVNCNSREEDVPFLPLSFEKKEVTSKVNDTFAIGVIPIEQQMYNA